MVNKYTDRQDIYFVYLIIHQMDQKVYTQNKKSREELLPPDHKCWDMFNYQLYNVQNRAE